MRVRLLVILLALMATALVALGVPLARTLAEGKQQEMFFDRLSDTTRFANIAGQDPGREGTRALIDELVRYDEVYGIEAVVYNRDATVLAQSRDVLSPPDDRMHANLAAALRGRAGENPAQIWPWQDRPLVIAEPVMSGGDVIGAVLTVSPTDRLRDQVTGRWLLLGLGELAALLLCMLVALRLTRWVLAPVDNLDSVTHAIATGQFSSRVSDRVGPPELRRLATSFNEMADHLQEVISQQRAFVADASHQLRNPLSALLLRIENIGLGLPPEWLDELEETRTEGRRLTEVLDELLALAQAEHAAARPARFDAATTVRERLAAWRLVAATRQISLVQGGLGLSESACYADRTALGSALDAVLDNAIKFSPADSTIDVTVVRDADTVGIVVRDRGPGVAPDELPAVGRRFWRSPRNVNVGGSGLGLSIATALLTSSGGGLSVALAEPTGLAVTLRVPRRPPAAPAAVPPARAFTS
ncbi:HAMP domain-containing histidine kinase [Frankia sp. CNm7]|uniref:histidine kinase n=1 Tax=Frankia nepalensis TaxID=1836974 RepID=A0A937RR84_9ACTN|nr:HAMP domain-containing sensor histidine kinase [Frankia nepalensis]MBL7501205.1 HAMP domain-containing histidine kinase [Frankia nepalensis]MBL7511609.1 HAMP domain-containing histidine kinase [Frankia nepalensis]MBL7518884.1 HAMP domain-containing histidine kinase [Frankia nepalensis]MBL7631223.1 HAMP domain-containing histidine kinase [Frankia nepalensis]